MKEKITERDLTNPEYRGFPTDLSKLQDGNIKLKSEFTTQATNRESQDNLLDNKQK